MEILVIWLLFGAAAFIVANSKGKPGCGWFALGALFGPLALLAALLMAGKQCPHCKSKVHEDATVCPKCQRDLPPSQRKPPWCAEPSRDKEALDRFYDGKR